MYIDVVIPSYNRLWSLKKTVAHYLEIKEIRQVIVVDDKSNDGTLDWLKSQCSKNQRFKYESHKKNRGASASRNTGADLTRAPYVFFADDDMLLRPAADILFLIKEMRRQNADIAAPLHILPESLSGYVLPVINDAGDSLQSSIFNSKTLELLPRRKIASYSYPRSFITPLTCGIMMVRREVLSKVRYDENLGVTSYRDETDFQLKALNEGYRLIACSRPVLIDLKRISDDGGCHRLRTYAEYEWMAIKNNWRILKRHHQVIRKCIGIQTPIALLQACFIAEHGLNRLVRNYVVRVLRSTGIHKILS